MTTLKKNPISINYAKGEAFVLKKGIAFYAGDGTRITDKRPVSNEHAIEYIARHETHINHFDSVNSEVLDAALKPKEEVKKETPAKEVSSGEDQIKGKDYAVEFGGDLQAIKAYAKGRNITFANSAKYDKIVALLIEQDKA